MRRTGRMTISLLAHGRDLLSMAGSETIAVNGLPPGVRLCRAPSASALTGAAVATGLGRGGRIGSRLPPLYVVVFPPFRSRSFLCCYMFGLGTFSISAIRFRSERFRFGSRNLVRSRIRIGLGRPALLVLDHRPVRCDPVPRRTLAPVARHISCCPCRSYFRRLRVHLGMPAGRSAQPRPALLSVQVYRCVGIRLLCTTPPHRSSALC